MINKQSNSPDTINLLKTTVTQNGIRDLKKSKWCPIDFLGHWDLAR